MFSFSSRLVKPEGTGTWTYAPVPPEVELLLGERGLIKVKGTVNGVPVQSSLMPQGDGSHYIVINKSIREKAGVKAGDPVKLELELDATERQIAIPDDLKQLLDKNPPANLAFNALSYSHRKEYVDYINAAKRADTRSRRLEKILLMISQKKALK
jgi:hypothetical protein